MRQNQFITPFKVGLLVIAGGLMTFLMFTTLEDGGFQNPFAEEVAYTVYAEFDDVTGLARNSRVRMSGIPVGFLKDIELVGDKARVEIRITKDIELHQGIQEEPSYYRNGATVKKRLISFIGDYFLEITPGQAGPVIEDGGEIKNVTPTLGPNEIFARLNEVAADIQGVTKSLRNILGGPKGEQRVKQMMDDMQRMVDTLSDFVDTNNSKINNVLTNAEQISSDIRLFAGRGTKSLNQTLGDARDIVKELKSALGDSKGDLQKGIGTVRGTLKDLQKTLATLDKSLKNVEQITGNMKEGRGTVGKLLTDETIANETERIVKDAGDLVNRVSRLKTIVELRSEWHFQHQQMKNVFGLRLQPEPYKYYLFEFVDDYRGTTSVVTKDVNTTNERKDPVYRRTTVKTTHNFKFSAQMARGTKLFPWMSVTGRFGIIESSGGIGLDVGLGNDDFLELQTDLFDFGLAANPRLRSFGTWQFWKFAHVSAGIDDVLNEGRRDYFLGAGISFDDKDLKALITTTGVPSP
jgi:phospholipid/cholesterol/gamma-HCH transport system substrate-binding protein